MRWREALQLSILGCAAASAGCTLFFPTPKPMRTIAHPAPPSSQPAKCAVVFLPGFGDGGEQYDENGFPEAFRARNLSVDSVLASATFGYYMDRSLLVRLREDVVQPIRAKGYKEVWVVGISMGGLGTVLLARDQEPSITGIVLFAPYLGTNSLLHEINVSGGLQQWNPGPPSQDDYRELWRYLKRVTATPGGSPEIFLGAGDQDPHRSPGPHPLADALPRDHLFRTPGGHDWGPWRVLWADFLDHSDFRAHCGSGA
jgi:pimeloyl-ACP methyl ester carboxylesterase